MSETLYLECYSGISGDMTVAALLDLGADQKVLLDGLNSLGVDGYRIEIGRRSKNSIDACDFNVILEGDTTEHSHGHLNEYTHEHSHKNSHIQGHCHEELTHEHAPATNHPVLVLGHHEHRNLHEINAIIDHSEITPNAKAIAKKIFHIIAVAEAKVHAKPLEEVHFHEVGAIDSIVDIVAVAICLDNLKIKEVIVSELYEGTGQIACQHGLLPIPVPAVANIATEHQLPIHITTVKGELVTPTGAAIVAAIRTGTSLPKEMKIRKLGLGAGKRSYPGSAGILRAMLIEEVDSSAIVPRDKVWVLEANIDDCTGEALAFTLELLLENGAKDVYYTPIFMKKNRPAYMLGVICREMDIPKLESIIFHHTTTIGIRKYEAERTILPREQRIVSTPYGDAQVKVCTSRDNTFVYPEYESVKKLCRSTGLDYQTMFRIIQDSYKEV